MTDERVEYVEVKKEALTLERIALAAVVALLSWNVYTTNQLSINQAVMSQQINGFNATITTFARDRYTRSEATAERAVIENRVARLEAWNERLSDRLAETNAAHIALKDRLRDVTEDKGQ